MKQLQRLKKITPLPQTSGKGEKKNKYQGEMSEGLEQKDERNLGTQRRGSVFSVNNKACLSKGRRIRKSFTSWLLLQPGVQGASGRTSLAQGKAE